METHKVAFGRDSEGVETKHIPSSGDSKHWRIKMPNMLSKNALKNSIRLSQSHESLTSISSQSIRHENSSRDGELTKTVRRQISRSATQLEITKSKAPTIPITRGNSLLDLNLNRKLKRRNFSFAPIRRLNNQKITTVSVDQPSSSGTSERSVEEARWSKWHPTAARVQKSISCPEDLLQLPNSVSYLNFLSQYITSVASDYLKVPAQHTKMAILIWYSKL